MKSTATILPGTVGAELKGPGGCLVRAFTFAEPNAKRNWVLFVFPSGDGAVDYWWVKYGRGENCSILGIDTKLSVSENGKTASVEWKEKPTVEEVIADAFGWQPSDPYITEAISALREAGLLNEKRDNKG